MPSKPKGSRYKYLSKIILAIFELKNSDQLYNKTAYHFKISKFFVTTIFY